MKWDQVPDEKKITHYTKTKLEALGYNIEHLSPSEIDELIALVEREQPATTWRLKL